MRKSLKIALGVTLGLGVFSAGFFGKDIVTKATTDWSTNAQNAAYSDFLSTANKTTSDLTSNTTDDINNTINTAIQGTVEDQQKQLEDLLQQYYQMKLQGLTNTDKYKALEQQIKDIQASVLSSFKSQIDDAFAKAEQGQ